MAEHQLEFNGQTIETDAKGYLLTAVTGARSWHRCWPSRKA